MIYFLFTASFFYFAGLLDGFGASNGFASAEKLRFCIVDSVHTAKRINKTCPELKSADGNQVECVVANDRLNCLRRLAVGDADFAIFEPEDLVIVALSHRDYDILVTHELRLAANDTQRFAMVAVVSGEIKTASDLRGKRYCHGGFVNSDDSTRIFASYFQNWIIPRKCESGETLVENEFSGLSMFFEAACISGPWTQDSSYDSRLKAKYTNLCSLCDNPAGCYSTDKYHGREGAMLCLTENNDVVAWVRIEDALRHFKTQSVNESNYGYLCPDGTTRTVGEGRPCVWLTKPWPVVAANRPVAERVAKLVNSIKERRFPWQIHLERLMESYRLFPVATETPLRPDDFLRRYPGFSSANTRAGCRPSRLIRWCVASNVEYRKCQWLRDASLAYGLEPPISCNQQPNRTCCIDALKTGRCDIFFVKPEEEFQAIAKGSRSLLRATTNKKQDFNVFAALVKNNSKYRTIDELKGSKACFTGYRSIGWNAFVDAISNSDGSTGSPKCLDDIQTVANFFKDVYIPRLNELASVSRDLPSNFHNLPENGENGSKNATLGAAFSCLTSGNGDVAFLRLENGLEKKKLFEAKQHFRTVCIDPSESNSDDLCFLTWTDLGSVMIDENMSDLRAEEIYSALVEFDILFGRNFDGQTPGFSLYGDYDGVSDVIFSERTQHLQRRHEDSEQQIHLLPPHYYGKIVERLTDDRCKRRNDRNAANRRNATGILFLVVSLLFLDYFFKILISITL